MRTWKAITLSTGGLALLMTGVVQPNLVVVSVLGFVIMCVGLGSLFFRRAMPAGIRWVRTHPRRAALLAAPVAVLCLVAATHDGPADTGRDYGQELASNFAKGGRAANEYACTQQAIVIFGSDSGKVRAFEGACAAAYNNGIAAYR